MGAQLAVALGDARGDARGDAQLPPGWVRVPHAGDLYYWDTTTQEVTWGHPSTPAKKKACRIA